MIYLSPKVRYLLVSSKSTKLTFGRFPYLPKVFLYIILEFLKDYLKKWLIIVTNQPKLSCGYFNNSS